jgi:hypothetical protein
VLKDPIRKAQGKKESIITFKEKGIRNRPTEAESNRKPS